jgi:hypothetical protein
MATGFQVIAHNAAAPFSLKLHRGDGMTLLAMDWKRGTPPPDFVGFAIEYKEPDGDRFFALKNRLNFPGPGGAVDPRRSSTRLAPIQMFRWVHFPRNAELPGKFTYRVTPVFMNELDELSYGVEQEAAIELRRETYPGRLNVTFTRGFISSQAFVDRYLSAGPISALLPARADEGLTFAPTHPKTVEALEWMGFEARSAILEVLDRAIADPGAQVRVVAYDLNEPGLVTRLEQLGPRLKVIIDDEGDHGAATSAETQAAARLAASAGSANVKRQHMGKLQHNKTIVVDGPRVQAVVCGSTNFSWRGLFVQSNNALVLQGSTAVHAFLAAFDAYWQHGGVAAFGRTGPAQLTVLTEGWFDLHVGFAPFASQNALLARIAADIEQNTTSSLFYSLAFLYQTQGPIREAVKKLTEDGRIFVYGVSDKTVGGITVQKPNGNRVPVSAAALGRDAPEPFKSEPVGGGGTRMHHKFVVIDFDKPTARVYMGSYNFSAAADKSNGENILLIRNRRVAVSYAIEALRIIDHYHFRARQEEEPSQKLVLARPPRQPGEQPWWERYYSDPHYIRDRELFA